MEGLDKKKILVVCGPTASGKSGLALHLSNIFKGEMVGADSMQIYKGLTVGTAAVTQAEAGNIPQHMVGFLKPEVSYSVADYLLAARKVISEIHSRGNLPVVCGGTGLYISSLVKGVSFTEQPVDITLRNSLEAEWDEACPEKMLEKLNEVDPELALRLHLNDKKRILRGLEQFKLTGSKMADRNKASLPEEMPYDVLCIAPDFPREVLYSRIHKRIQDMLENGLLDEAELVYNNKDRYITAAQAIGYKEFFPYFAEGAKLDSCVERLKQSTRNYAKRQLTWFRRMPLVKWVGAEENPETDITCKAERLVMDFLAGNSVGELG